MTLLAEGESERADFKRAPDGIGAEDLVAFANTDAGGNILAGIEEIVGADGTQRGAIKGCDVSDATILQVLNKAVSCVPPVAIDVHIENLRAKAILRIAIPPSENRPHCTPKGIYCRRDGSRNRPLHPPELLRMFLEIEARAFADRFESAANKIGKNLKGLETTLQSSIKSMGDQLGWAEFQLGDTESTLGSIQAYIRNLNVEANDTSERLRALFRQDRREDPVRAKVRKELLDQAIKQLSKEQNLVDQFAAGKTLQISATGKAALELDKDDLSGIITEAIAFVREKVEAAKYSVEVKAPDECRDDELKTFAAIVSEGDEVVAGVEHRLKRAAALGFVKFEGNIVGTAALKRPLPTYKKRTFGNAKSKKAVSDFPLELGWIYLKPVHRQKKQMRRLLDVLLKRAAKAGIFATTRASNEKMQTMLSHQGFVREGSAYASSQHPKEELLLFVRMPASA